MTSKIFYSNTRITKCSTGGTKGIIQFVVMFIWNLSHSEIPMTGHEIFCNEFLSRTHTSRSTSASLMLLTGVIDNATH